MTTTELRRRYAELFGDTTNSHNRIYLTRRIAWRLQERAYGGLSERARRRAAELARDASLRMNPPQASEAGAVDIPAGCLAGDPTRPFNASDLLPGTLLRRRYKNRVHVVQVLADGFLYEENRYASLSAIAVAITGSHWSGYHFFGLRRRKTR